MSERLPAVMSTRSARRSRLMSSRNLRHCRVKVGLNGGPLKRVVTRFSFFLAMPKGSWLLPTGPCSETKTFACVALLVGLKVWSMRLAQYLADRGIKRGDFAREVGISGGW